ncbi:hypothetical protein PRIPAC_87348 [Pristionchus pacificus]|uniref:G protein-coupled receptor n=1 Tax=Pristionchus pacificus TaxID=54126 RepID=A0A2A6CZE7_PRIPA|nr:hypothetical protein PRIPAC_87348 [Pristionchus pacificus]|eukprot:PDM83480.1 G protein-coupled receptor [Pristionchus pacificus]
MTVNNLVFICYGVPLVIVYGISLISVVSIRKRFTTLTTFVPIYALTAAVNLLTYVNAWLALRLYQEQFFNFYYHFVNQFFILSLVHQYLVGLFYFAQNINSSLLTIDRFVYIVKPNWVDKWRIHWWKVAASLYALVGVLNFFVAGFDSYIVSAYIYNEATDSFIMKTRTGARINVFIGIEAITGIIFVVFCATINDRSFFFISLTIFISQSCNIIIIAMYFYCYVVSYNRQVLSIVLIDMLYISDVFSLGPGLYTLLVPGPIRRATVRVVLPATARISPSTDTQTSLTSISGRIKLYHQK